MMLTWQSYAVCLEQLSGVEDTRLTPAEASLERT